jgi:hypothetical protein
MTVPSQMGAIRVKTIWPALTLGGSRQPLLHANLSDDKQIGLLDSSFPVATKLIASRTGVSCANAVWGDASNCMGIGNKWDDPISRDWPMDIRNGPIRQW